MARRTAHTADHGLRSLAAVLSAGARAETRVTAIRVFPVVGRDTGGLLRADATSQTCVYPAFWKVAIGLCHGHNSLTGPIENRLFPWNQCVRQGPLANQKCPSGHG